MPSFDVVSKVNMAEVDNALQQAIREITQRYDFKGTDTTIEREDKVITIDSADDFKVKASLDVLESKLVKRGVSLKSLKYDPPEPSAKGRTRQKLHLQQGIERDHARELIQKIKDSKLKVQGAIQEDQIRVSAKKRDDLQATISLLKEADFTLPLQFENFRD